MKLRDNLNTEIRYKELIQKKTSFVEEDLHEYQCTGTTWDSKQELSHFDIILRNAYQILISKYSAGYPVLELIPDYLQGVQFMKKGWNTDAGYVTMLWYLSIGVMLECHKELQQLSILLRELSVNDKLFSFLVNNTQDYASEKLLWTTPYAGLIEVIEFAKTNKEKAVERLQKYLKKEWYKGHSDCGWYNDHKSKWGVHFGYWSFESGALVKILGLDDSSLQGLPYYPYDMVHCME
ncbi:PoNi-like cognate immunity protein [Hoylesella timonensis]|uniref:PoNi-like cognate immunity protein n=1 Tax=Hoylesella timonensis TaxID=386414 RepID=UPI0018997121|nr:PoNi-like cognate immunity protein [Hoylesella timonensis]